MKRQGVDHEVMRARLQIQPLVIGDDAGLRQPRPPKVGKGRNDGRGRKGSVNFVESFLDLVSRLLLQEKGG
jgi:hypothetical protein